MVLGRCEAPSCSVGASVPGPGWGSSGGRPGRLPDHPPLLCKATAQDGAHSVVLRAPALALGLGLQAVLVHMSACGHGQPLRLSHTPPRAQCHGALCLLLSPNPTVCSCPGRVRAVGQGSKDRGFSDLQKQPLPPECSAGTSFPSSSQRSFRPEELGQGRSSRGNSGPEHTRAADGPALCHR